MASKYWIKLYHEVLHDPKMGLLPDNLWRRTIELFLLAGEVDKEGYLPTTDEIAWVLRLNAETLEAELHELEKVRILQREGDLWLVRKFAKRQEAVKADERMRQMRARRKKEIGRVTPVPPQGDVDSNEVVTRTVTKRNTDIDTDIDKDTTPNGVGEKTPEKPGPKTLVMNKFIETSHLKMPKRKKDSNYWWSEVGNLLDTADHDPIKACNYVDQTVKFMRGEKMAIKGPQSILWGIIQLSAGEPLTGDKRNGKYSSNGTKGTEQRGTLKDKATYTPKRFRVSAE